jgi:hypothetical protein
MDFQVAEIQKDGQLSPLHVVAFDSWQVLCGAEN